MENNFEKFGFKAEFEGMILGSIDGYFVGWIKRFDGEITSCLWDKDGKNRTKLFGSSLQDTLVKISFEVAGNEN